MTPCRARGHRHLPRLLGYAETAAEVDRAHLGETLGQLAEQLPDLAPVAHVEDAAAVWACRPMTRVPPPRPGDRARRARRAEFRTSSARPRCARGRGGHGRSPCPPGRGRRGRGTAPASDAADRVVERECTPCASAHSYSDRGAKFGVKSTLSRSMPGTTSSTRSHSPCDTHSKARPSAAKVRRISWMRVGLHRVEHRSTPRSRAAGGQCARASRFVHVGATVLARDVLELRPASLPPRRSAGGSWERARGSAPTSARARVRGGVATITSCRRLTSRSPCSSSTTKCDVRSFAACVTR